MISNDKLKQKILNKCLVEDFSDKEKNILSDFCCLDNGVKVNGVKLPYLDVKYLRNNSEPIYKTDGVQAIKNDFAILVDGENSGEVFVIPCDGILGSTLKKLNISENVSDKYIRYFIDLHKNMLKNNKTGSAIPHLNKKLFANLPIYVPSLETQEKIVSKIEELFELIDKKEKNDQEKEKLKEILKSKILDSAIHGELVEQIVDETNSLVLIEHIKKIREELILKKEIRQDSKINYNLPTEKLPLGWNWVRLGDLGAYKKGPFGSSLTKDMFVSDGPTSYKVYEQKNAIQKDWKLGNYFITKEKYDSMRGFMVNPHDIIVSCAGTIGEIYVIPDDAREGIINQALMKITLFDNAIMEYYLMYFDHVLKHESREKGKGTAISNIPPFDVLKNIYIPLPPLEEQKRIMKKISQCFELIEQL